MLEVGDGIARIYGLGNAMAGEMLEFENGIFAQVLNLEEDSIGAVILGELPRDQGRDAASSRPGASLAVPVGDGAHRPRRESAGPAARRARARSSPTRTRPLEMIAPGIADRQPVKQPLQTGIKAIDAMTPIGRGQRELIIGDRKTGKTAIAIDTIINQKSENVICVYVAIGQKESTVAGVVETLRKRTARWTTRSS